AGPATRLIDANGRLLLPGFNDSHVHIMAVGNLFSSADLSSAVTEKDVVDRLSHFARFLPKGRWILGSKLDPTITLTRSAVDAVTPENPVFIYHSDPKSALTNSMARRQAKVDSEDGFVRTASLAAVRSVVPKNHVRDWPAIAESAM